MKTPARLFVLSVLLVLSPAAAQYPRPLRHPFSSYDLAAHLTSARFTRVVVVDSSGGGDYKKISDALAYVATKKSSERNWTTRWTVVVYPGQRGSTDPNVYGYNYSETSLTIPAYTEVMGFATGQSDPIAWMGGTPVIELRATSGTLVKLGGGSSLTNLHFFWAQPPTAAVKGIDHTTVPDNDPANNNVSWLGQLTNVSFSLVAQNASFPVDGFTESSGGLVVHGGGVMLIGSVAGRAVVNAGDAGMSLYGGRYGGSSGCAALMANTAAGGLRLFAGVRMDADCANDLVRTGAGAIEVQGGVDYRSASGTIAHGTAHVPYGTALPSACSVGAAFLNTTSGAEKLCACTTANTWRCAPLQ
ncbi:MAG TPA: hypothetical protein VN493_31070 [Thermoanaerobaculia bacterium]|nr:hypothetical protein [Thermoanaerobaculia bacterium]